ncbi:MAG: MFS transporter [Moorea sp. SIO3I7]|uniref:MFS transporter n=1 Tax=Moorena sp. SIO3I8 TaxID=2607833 RepID=UPI0013BF7E52|nr:MFS transporter [Moorena sp. SIO3I8]NEN96343.1 MFS transporter [Moorena sp. SIO3I7]NEO06920.1 MFS transporter [Moorena sp. SIO3I8]
MIRSRNFIFITLADFIVRTAYQIGKTPLLPIFALSLGATDAYLGLIVSVSTFTGMLLKPFVGIFSDRWGRRSWLFLGTSFFSFIPFVYPFIHTPKQLFVVRIIHGLATAIYGPVTLAFVAEQSQKHLAERFGWFSMARSASYVIGPTVAGWLLLILSPASVFTVIGILSSVAFLPVFLLSESKAFLNECHTSLTKQIVQALKTSSCKPSVWFTGVVDTTMYIALYAVKAFLPIYALSIGTSTALIGGFFAVQEAVHMLFKPMGGRLGDRLGYLLTISLGMAVLGTALLLFNYSHSHFVLLVSFVLMGVTQALISPSTVALVTKKVDKDNLGSSLGLIGQFANAGKVAGPVIAGTMINWLDFTTTFFSIGGALIFVSVVLFLGSWGGDDSD